MTLRLPDKWVWDFWLARATAPSTTSSTCRRRGRSSSLSFATTMPRSGTPSRAISVDWRVLPDALHPGPDGSWDDLATWTGQRDRA